MSEALIIDSDRPADPIGKTLDIICRAFAICSGLMLTGMALMSVYSIVGRSFFDKPLLGDYELVQMMSAVAVTMALPFCQMVKGHIIVDFFTLHAPRRVNATLDTIADLDKIGAALLDLVRDLVALIQGTEPGGIDRREMGEHVGRAIVRSDEAVALVAVEPLDGTGSHCVFLLLY